MFDFECQSCNAKFEDLIQPDERTTVCPKCGATASRVISPVRIDRLSLALQEGFPGAADYFDRVHRERKAIEERSEANHGEGDYGKAAGSD